MNLDYEEPSVELVSFKALPANGFEQNFEIGLKLINPNNFELPFNGISYQLSVAGEALAQGVAANIPTAAAYGESRFVVPVSTNLLGGFKVIKALMNNQGQDISYQLKAKLDIAIPLVPKLTVIQDGIIPLGNLKGH
jgi:LEA14-like dessication related protein